MKTIPLHSLYAAADRQRQEYDETYIIELATSISKFGLLHPIVLKAGTQELLAGGCRAKAIQKFHGSMVLPVLSHDGEVVPVGEIPVTYAKDLDEIALQEAEFEENFRRRGLTWQEESDAVAKLHRMRTVQAAAIGEVHKVHDTAAEVMDREPYSAGVEKVRKQIILSQHLDNPEVAGAKNEHEAFKILKRQEEDSRQRELGARIGATFSSGVHEVHNIRFQDFIPKEQFDCICTDPPYGMGADGFGDAAGKLTGIEHGYDDSYENWLAIMGTLPAWLYAACKSQAHVYLFCDIDRFHELRTAMQAAGFYVFRTPFVYHKPNSGRVPLPDRGPRRTYELVLYAIKGGKPVRSIQPDVFSATADEQMGHGAQKPIDAFRQLLVRTIQPGDRVLDPFAGTGGCLVAGHELKCAVTALEKDPVSYGKCLERLQELGAQGTLL